MNIVDERGQENIGIPHVFFRWYQIIQGTDTKSRRKLLSLTIDRGHKSDDHNEKKNLPSVTIGNQWKEDIMKSATPRL